MTHIKSKIVSKVNYTFNITSICLLASLFLLSQCKTSRSTESTEVTEEVTPVIDNETNNAVGIVGVKWTHSREDDQGGLLNYQNAEIKTFPPSRFRNSFLFNENGTCAYMQLSPTDRHFMADGTYTYQENIISIFMTNGSEYSSYEVIEVAKDTLILKQMKRSTD